MVERLTILVFTLLIVACDSEKPIFGHYINSHRINDVIWLKKDGTFTLTKNNTHKSGHYQLRKTSLTLIMPFVDQAKLTNNIITDSSGETWRRNTEKKYINEKVPTDYILLNEDGTFLIEKKQKQLSGTYKITQEQLTLSVMIPSQSTLKSTTIIDNDGQTWEKE